MRIGWFTPFSSRSAIARFSRAVVGELSKIANVEICHFSNDDLQQTTVPVLHFSSAAAVSENVFSRYDLVVYNFGNHLPFHGEIYLLSRRLPGICILHDFVMHHFFAEHLLEHLNSPGTYSLVMERLYGEAGRISPEARIWESDEVVQYPMFEEVIRGALGVVTHSLFFAERVKEAFGGPTRRIALAYDAPQEVAMKRGELGVADDDILIVTVGHANPNKRIEDVINALGQIGDSARRVSYAVVGSCPAVYEERLRGVARANALEDRVHFLGHVPDDVLRSYLANADICVNLRFPSFEGASASVIEEMLCGKPVIVNDTGFFSELPDACVARVSLARHGELVTQLRRLVTEPEVRARIGANARQFANSEFRPSRYAAEILDFAWEARSAFPLLRLADQVAVELNRMGVTRGKRIVDELATGMNQFFCAEKSGTPLWRI